MLSFTLSKLNLKPFIAPLIVIANLSFSYANAADKLTAPKNIIMVIADGMGPSYTSAYRYFNDDHTTKDIEQTVFERHVKGLVSTYPASVSGYVTDSAAAATAMATGVKTYNDAIAVDINKKPLLTVLEWAKLQGKKTGIVITSYLNDATPAAYLTHNESRDNSNDIANSYLDKGIKADIYLGGGWKYFIREDRNLVEEYVAAGFQYIDNYQQLTQLEANKPVFGLFAEYNLPWALDDNNKHRLKSMLQAATKQLSYNNNNNSYENGFFMLVEASLIDWAGHDNDIVAAMYEMDDLAKAMLYLESFVKENPETLVILTADHSTGGFSIGAKEDYRWNAKILREMKYTPESIAKMIIEKGEVSIDVLNQWLNFTLTTNEFNKVMKAPSLYEKAQSDFKILDKSEQAAIIAEWQQPTLAKFYRNALMKTIDKRTNTGWTTKGHTGVDVPIHAFGKRSEVFSGQLDNTDIAKKIFNLMGRQQD